MTAAERLAPFFVVVTAVLAGMYAVDAAPIGVFYDDAHYVILGRSLATGEGYRYVNLPGAPVATHFPPGYPALLSALWLISPLFPENLALFKTVNVALLGAVALAVYVAARRWLDTTRYQALFVALASTVVIPTLLLSSHVMSEMLFLAVLLPLLLDAEDATRNDGLRRAVAIGALAGALCLIRTHAIVLIPAIAGVYAGHRRYGAAFVSLAAGILVLLPWLLWVRHYDPLVPAQLQGQYGSYLAWLARGVRDGGATFLITSLRDNLVTTYVILARSFTVIRHPILDAVAVGSVLTLFVAGTFALFRHARVMVVFLLLYLALVMVWPFSPLRFIWGVWPLLVITMVAGAVYLWRARSKSRLMRAVGGAASAIVLIGALFFNVQGYRYSWWATVSRSYAPRIQPQLVWVTAKTSRSEVVVTDDEGAVYLYTGRRALPASPFTATQHVRPRPLAQSADWLAETLRVFRPDYVVAWSKPTLDAAETLVARRPQKLVQVDTIPTGRVYRPTALPASAPSRPR